MFLLSKIIGSGSVRKKIQADLLGSRS